MKKFILFFFALSLSLTAAAKDLKVAIFKVPQLECVNCEAKVKRNISYEKGVKRLKSDIPNRLITITFDADKTTTDALIKGFEKFGYKAELVKVEAPAQKKKK